MNRAGTSCSPSGCCAPGWARGRRCCSTVAVLGVAAALRMALDSVGADRFPFVAFFPAVLVCATAAGWRYGVFALLVSAGLVAATNRGAFDIGFVVGMGLFGFGNLIMIAVAESARRARFRAEAEAASAHESERRFRVMADQRSADDLGTRSRRAPALREPGLGGVLRRQPGTGAPQRLATPRASRGRRDVHGKFPRLPPAQGTLQCDRAGAARGRRMALGRIARRAEHRAPRRTDFIRRHQPRRHRAPRARDRARGAARKRASGPLRRRDRHPGQGRVPGHAVARTAHAAVRDRAVEPHPRAQIRSRGATTSRRDSH